MSLRGLKILIVKRYFLQSSQAISFVVFRQVGNTKRTK